MGKIFSISHENDAELKQKLRDALIEREEWLTPKDVAYRFKVSGSALCMRLRRWGEDGMEIVAKRGVTGRIRTLKLTPELRARLEKMR